MVFSLELNVVVSAGVLRNTYMTNGVDCIQNLFQDLIRSTFMSIVVLVQSDILVVLEFFRKSPCLQSGEIRKC